MAMWLMQAEAGDRMAGLAAAAGRATAAAGGSSPAAAKDGSAPSPRLANAAHEFEAQMLKELIHPLLESSGVPGGDGEQDQSGSSGALGEYAAESLARGISHRGGVGIANRVIHDLAPRQTAVVAQR